jgi:hypothetical protein
MLDAHGRPKSPDQQSTGNEEENNSEGNPQSSHGKIINLSVYLLTDVTQSPSPNLPHKGRYFESRFVIVEFFVSMRPNPDLTPDFLAGKTPADGSATRPFPKKEGEYAHKSSYFENTYP